MIKEPTKLLTLEQKLQLKFAYSIIEVAELTGMARSVIYEAVTSGTLVGRKRGTRTFFLPDDLRAWLESMPTIAEARADPNHAQTGGRFAASFRKPKPVKRVLKPRRAVA